MAETPEAEIIAESFSIGDRMAEDVMRDLNEARHAPNTVPTI
jgi:hypothetical protein